MLPVEYSTFQANVFVCDLTGCHLRRQSSLKLTCSMVLGLCDAPDVRLCSGAPLWKALAHVSLRFEWFRGRPTLSTYSCAAERPEGANGQLLFLFEASGPRAGNLRVRESGPFCWYLSLLLFLNSHISSVISHLSSAICRVYLPL